jgi:predicted aconitase with swiveling domain
MNKIIIKGRGVVRGIAEGPAIVCPESIQGWAGIDDVTGVIIEKGHSEEGKSIKDSVLILPGSKGSNGWSCHFHSTKIKNTHPAAWIFTKLDSRAAVASVVLDIPTVIDLEKDPFKLVKTGDWVKVDGNNGIIEITPNNN